MNLNRLNYINILLMLLSLVGAIFIPIELFLFAYAVLGPLHYLTEISWLHDRSYFSHSKTNAIWLILIAIIISIGYFINKSTNFTQVGFMLREHNINAMMIILAFAYSVGFYFIKKRSINALFMLLSTILCYYFFNSRSDLSFFISLTLPTLVHVYFFTGLFILLGSLKSNSKSGYLSLLTYTLCPLLLWQLFPEVSSRVTDYGVDNFFKHSEGFGLLIYDLLGFFPEKFLTQMNGSNLYDFKEELFLVRFFAFAYLYHYLNWFSKTEVIKWNQIPKRRFQVILSLWVVSCGVYFYDYALGMSMLFFLSYCHVLLEFPLNILSMKEIASSINPLKRYFN